MLGGPSIRFVSYLPSLNLDRTVQKNHSSVNLWQDFSVLGKCASWSWSTILHPNSLSWGSIWILEPDPWPCFYRMSCLSNEFSLATCNVTFHQKRASNLDDLFLTPGSGTSSAWNENLRPLLNTNIPLIIGKVGLRNHSWPLESRFIIRKGEKNSIFSQPSQMRILISNSIYIWITSLQIKSFILYKSVSWGRSSIFRRNMITDNHHRWTRFK